MTTKAEFNAEEWQAITEAPAIAGLMVVSSQRGGAIRESLAIAKTYTEAASGHRGSDLLGEVVAKPPQLSRGEFKSSEELHAKGLERIQSAVALVETKASAEETEAYRDFILAVARRAAEADKSGGFLGIGGEEVSESERQVLERIAAALGIDAGD